MRINDKYLNSKPIYNVPEGVQIAEYMYSKNSNWYIEPKFTPDVCINRWGTIGVRSYKETVAQVCIKTEDVALLNYLRSYNWSVFNSKSISVSKCNKWQVEKIISEYYRGIK